MSELSFEDDFRPQRFGRANRGRSFSEDSLSSSEDGLSDYEVRRPSQVNPRNRAGSFTSSVAAPISVYQYDGPESEFDRGSSYVGPRPQRRPTVYQARDSEVHSESGSSEFDDAASRQGMPGEGPMGEIEPDPVEGAEQQAPIDAHFGQQRQRSIEVDSDSDDEPMSGAPQGGAEYPLIEEEQENVIPLIGPGGDAARVPDSDEDFSDGRRKPARAQWWKDELEAAALKRKKDEAAKFEADRLKRAVKSEGRGASWMWRLFGAARNSTRDQVAVDRAAAGVEDPAAQGGAKRPWLQRIFGRAPKKARDQHANYLAASRGQSSDSRRGASWMSRLFGSKPRDQRANQPTASRGQLPASGSAGTTSRLAKAVEMGGAEPEKFQASDLAKGLKAYGGYVANRDGRPGDEDPLRQGVYDVAKAKKDFDFMRMNMVDVPQGYATSVGRAIGQIPPAKPKEIGLQNLPPVSVMATVQPRTGLMAMNLGAVVNSSASDTEKVGHDARLGMAKQLDRLGRLGKDQGKAKFRAAVRAVAQNQKLAKARRAQGLATVPARSMDETAAMNNRKVEWNPDEPVTARPEDDPYSDYSEVGPLKMPKLGEGEAPQLSVGGALATGAHKVGGFLGHAGRIIDNTDKGAEELAAGKPGLGLVKSTAALGVWGSRKVLGAPLKSIPIPLMDQLGGEVGKAVYSAGGLMVEGAGKAVRGLTERKAMEQRRAHAYRDFVGETSKDEDGEAIERGVVDASGHQAGDTNESLEALRSDFVGGEGQGEGGERVGQNWQSLRNRVLAQGVTFGPQFAKQGIEKDRSAWTNYRQGDVRDEVVDGVRVPYKDKNLNDDTTAPVSIKDTMTASDKRSANAAGLPQQSIGWGEYMKMRVADRANKAENDLAEYATLPRDQAKKAGGLLWQGLTSAGGDSAWTGPKIRHAHRDASEVPNVPEGWTAMDAEQRKAHVGEEKWGSHEATYRRERQAGHDDKLIWDDQAMEAGSKPGFFRKLLLGDRRERIPRTRMVKDENTQEMRKEWLRSPRVNFNGRSNMLKPDDPRLQYHGQSGVDALTKSLDGYIATREFGTRMPDPVPEPAPEANLAKARAKGAEMLQKAQVARMDTDAFGARAVQDKAVKDQIKHWMGTAKNLPVGDGQGPDFDVNDEEENGEAERASVQGNPVFDRPDFDVDDDEGSGAFGGISLAGSESQGSDPRPREDDARFKDKGSGEGMNYVSAFESELDAWKARNPGRS